MNYRQFLYEEVPVILRGLNADTPALWGKMNAQQMIEHLTFVVGISNRRFDMQPNADPNRLAYRKMRFLEQDIPFARSIRVAFVSEEPMPLQFANIEDSKQFLFNQLQRFDDYFTEHPGMMPNHIVFGPMNFEEWIQFHARHFRHHFQQFGLVEMAEIEK